VWPLQRNQTIKLYNSTLHGSVLLETSSYQTERKSSLRKNKVEERNRKSKEVRYDKKI
jgi:hypothetical protein